MKPYSRLISAFSLGLFASQIIFTFLVLESNAALLLKIRNLLSEGYLTVPNPTVLPSLSQLKPAFCGAVFFTLTAGAFISFTSVFWAFFWENTEKGKMIAVFSGLFLLSALVVLNYNGFCLYVSLAIILVPLVTIFSFWSIPQNRRAFIDFRGVFIQALSLVVLLLILISVFIKSDKDIFIDFRDNFLFSNAVGKTINDYYYKYTLYPAEVFKSFKQKNIVTCSINSDSKYYRKIESVARQRDYLNINPMKNPEIQIHLKDDLIVLQNSNGAEYINIETKQFLSDPEKYFKQFSDRNDRYGTFRLFILIALLTAFPLFFYMMLHYCIFMLLNALRLKRNSYTVASMIVFAIALASFFILVAADRMPANDTIARRFIQSELQNERISAFKYIIRNKEIAHLIDLYDVKQLDKAGVAERYWFANASSLRAKETFDVLVRQLGDPQANVVCQAIYALGKSNERKALNYIMDVVRKSDHWYIQWYAYRALVNLGWRQAYKEIKENNGDDEKQ